MPCLVNLHGLTRKGLPQYDMQRHSIDRPSLRFAPPSVKVWIRHCLLRDMSRLAVSGFCSTPKLAYMCSQHNKLTISTQHSIEIVDTFTLKTESCRVTYSFLTQTTCGVILTWREVISTYTKITIISCISYITYTVIWIWQVYTGSMWSTRAWLAVVNTCKKNGSFKFI